MQVFLQNTTTIFGWYLVVFTSYSYKYIPKQQLLCKLLLPSCCICLVLFMHVTFCNIIVCFLTAPLVTIVTGRIYSMKTSSYGNVFGVTGFCAGKSPVTCEFSPQRPLTRIFDVFFDLHLNQQLDKQSKHRWFETPSRSVWRLYNVVEWICGHGASNCITLIKIWTLYL